MIETLFEAGYSVKDTSIALGVSESTLFRKMGQFGLSKLAFTEIDEEELNIVVATTITEFPRCGEEMLRKVLLQKGIKVQRFRLRQCLKHLDEDGIRARKRRRLRRRIYNVSAPNCLWHIDSNHKLIRWHFVIIGGIDGFSRLVTYLRCTDNNKAETVLHCFRDGVSKFGVPDRVRSDQGRENMKVADFMINARGTGRGSMLTGKSTHNQRIERLWRDVYDGVLSYFYDLFYFFIRGQWPA
ncbi:uncharacterized protein LOC127878877 [Dreissena polymorpha]|uniref:uncharacterized protein LOC127878877 n=1 Tax=Dreissena polymorpha TaxID=45954 RepID=UPI002264AE9A|nr:uncharacterized protein LOC127878877 [Dreissena polymorpha]